MTIHYHEKNKSFHLTNGRISYQFSVEEQDFLIHNYWGRAVKDNFTHADFPLKDRGFSPNPSNYEGREFSLNVLPQEFPTNGFGDYRETILEHRYEDGSFITQVKYKSYEISKGKPALEKLPHTNVSDDCEAETLEIYLIDELHKIDYTLSYTIFADLDVIARSVKVKNNGADAVEINKLLSMSVDFDHSDFDLIQLPGGWGRERDIQRSKLARGVHKLDSKRGTTGHNYQPFFALANPYTTENNGEVYGFHFVYSGEFLANIEVDEFDKTRAQMGINPEHFNWRLNSGETFQAPEVVMVYSNNGLNQLSQTYHHLYQNHLVRGRYQFEERPVLLNNWEGTYFDFTEEKIEEMADEAVDLGIELFVLDDGWFGHRDSDNSSLGDWFVYEEKLPSSLKTLAEKIKAKGLKFGLWFEPEMISKDSKLYRQHPEWLLKASNRQPSHSRSQYVLDYSQPEVRENIVSQLRVILDEVPIDYIKWDFNRNLTEIGSQSGQIRDGEVSHRFILGLYEVLEELTTSYPDILWESCSGGGGRYDPGMLYYMAQTWTSDNTDAVARLEIQTGTSLVMPISSMGAHVSAVPNHQVNRTTSLKFRGDVAMSGNLGYELDVTKMSAREKEMVKDQISFYKENRELVQFGNFYRILSPFDGNDTAWIFVDNQKEEALFYYYKIMDKTNSHNPRVKFTGLDAKKKYRLNETNFTFYGNELMYKGLYIELPEYHSEMLAEEDNFGDFHSIRIKLKAV